MINSTKIREWINEIEERPMIAPYIVRRLSDRLIELDQMNEELRAENLSIRSGEKVQEYIQRIEELEYQVELLKRQLDHRGESSMTSPRLLIYRSNGQVLALDTLSRTQENNQQLARFEMQTLDPSEEEEVRMLLVDPVEELMLLYNTGRVATLPVGRIPVQKEDCIRWEEAFQADLRVKEQLIALAPISRMLFHSHGIQLSRRGYVKRITSDYFQTFLSSGNLGTGVKERSDQTFDVFLCDLESYLIVVSHEGYVLGIPSEKLPVTSEALLKPGINDYLVAAFAWDGNQPLFFVTGSGCVYRQESSWVNVVNTMGNRGRALKRRRPGSNSSASAKDLPSADFVVGACPYSERGWGAVLWSSGVIILYHLAEIDLDIGFPDADIHGSVEAFSFTEWTT